MKENCIICDDKIKPKGSSPIGLFIKSLGFCTIFCFRKKHSYKDVKIETIIKQAYKKFRRVKRYEENDKKD